jgi:hypothetical protein
MHCALVVHRRSRVNGGSGDAFGRTLSFSKSGMNFAFSVTKSNRDSLQPRSNSGTAIASRVWASFIGLGWMIGKRYSK